MKPQILSVTRARALLMSMYLFAPFTAVAADHGEEIAASVEARTKEIGQSYLRAVDSLQRMFQDRGNLQDTLAAKNEFARFATAWKIGEVDLVQRPAQLLALQQEYKPKLESITGEVVSGLLLRLEEEKRLLTKVGDLDGAIKLQEQVDALSKQFGISPPIDGTDLILPEILPEEVEITQDHGIPVKVEGEVVGTIRLKAGERYALVNVEGKLLVLQVGRTEYRVPMSVTNFIEELGSISKNPDTVQRPSGKGRGGLHIIKATYGADSRIVDVTDKLRAEVRNDSLLARSGSHLAGHDPAFGTVKETRITYELNGERREAVFREGQEIRIPQ